MAESLISTAIAAGARFGNYILRELIGRGGFAEVWKAFHHEQEHREVAIKIVIDPEFRKQLASEAKLPPLKHERIVPIIDSDTRFAEIPYVVMPHYSGGTLKDLIAANPNGLPEDRVEQILTDILSALSEAHDKGIIHRDLKPSNILLDEAGRAHISDFGLSRNLNAAEISQSMVQSASMTADAASRIVGTLAYMAPELCDGHPAGKSSDVFSLGIMLFEMLAGHRPFGVQKPSDCRDRLKKGPLWDELYSRACHSPSRRYSGVGSMLTALHSMLQQLTVEKLPMGGVSAGNLLPQRRECLQGDRVPSEEGRVDSRLPNKFGFYYYRYLTFPHGLVHLLC
ncbi:Serine/threonine-protein kinase PknB [Phycisphaerae bacterium RAS2]|nr:Serine/threonine-protein kinase PknB [Phycisphaerae bacterium RAS2]